MWAPYLCDYDDKEYLLPAIAFERSLLLKQHRPSNAVRSTIVFLTDPLETDEVTTTDLSLWHEISTSSISVGIRRLQKSKSSRIRDFSVNVYQKALSMAEKCAQEDSETWENIVHDLKIKRILSSKHSLRQPLTNRAAKASPPAPITKKTTTTTKTKTKTQKTTKTTNEKRVLECRLCHRKFKRQLDLNKHFVACQRSHNQEHGSGSGKQKENEKQINKEPMNLTCPHCKRTFKAVRGLKTHIIRFCSKRNDKKNNTTGTTPGNKTGTAGPKTKGVGASTCAACARTFRTKKGLKVHIRLCQKQKQISVENDGPGDDDSDDSDDSDSDSGSGKCRDCGRQFKYERGLRMHQLFCKKRERKRKRNAKPVVTAQKQDDKSEDEKTFECDICGREFTSERSLISHRGWCAKRSKTSRARKKANNNTKSNNSSNTSTKTQKLSCQFCKLAFRSEQAVKDHQRYCRAKRIQEAKREVIELDSETDSEESAEDDNNVISCAQCGREFSSERKLNTHKRQCTDDQHKTSTMTASSLPVDNDTTTTNTRKGTPAVDQEDLVQGLVAKLQKVCIVARVC